MAAAALFSRIPSYHTVWLFFKHSWRLNFDFSRTCSLIFQFLSLKLLMLEFLLTQGISLSLSISSLPCHGGAVFPANSCAPYLVFSFFLANHATSFLPFASRFCCSRAANASFSRCRIRNTNSSRHETPWVAPVSEDCSARRPSDPDLRNRVRWLWSLSIIRLWKLLKYLVSGMTAWCMRMERLYF